MKNTDHSVGYVRGRTEGFNKGKQDGFNQGRQVGKQQGQEPSQEPSQGIQPPTLHEISLRWRERSCGAKLSNHFNRPVDLNDHAIALLKETKKSAIWKLELVTGNQSFPIILKAIKAPIVEKSLVELNMYRYTGGLFQEFMPCIYAIEEGMNGDDVWVFMEYVPPIKGQLIFTPDCFDRMIPSIAKLHARTYKDRFKENEHLFAGWLPQYHSDSNVQERQRINGKTIHYLNKAMEVPELKLRLETSYPLLERLLQQGPDFLPELLQAGTCIVHHDLQTPNIGCNHVEDSVWKLKFLDWEGARLDPCWYDMFHLIGLFFAYRRDWRQEEEAVVQRCSHLYAEEMAKYDIVFQQDPVKLFKMAYVQRVLERSLYLQLLWAVEGHKPAYLLEGYLNKIKVWGKEVGLV